MIVSPINVGMHCYTWLHASRPHPVVLTMSPSQVRIAGENEIFHDGPADQLEAEDKTLKASIELRPSGGNPLYTAALGAASCGDYIPRRPKKSCAPRSVQPRIRRPLSWKRGGPCGSAAGTTRTAPTAVDCKS